MFGRDRTTRAQARRDREWREFVNELDGSSELSPAQEERMRALLEIQTGSAPAAGPTDLENPSAERAA